MSLNINNSLMNRVALTTKTVPTQAAAAETETAATVASQNGATAQVDTSYTAIANDVIAANLGVTVETAAKKDEKVDINVEKAPLTLQPDYEEQFQKEAEEYFQKIVDDSVEQTLERLRGENK